MSTASLPHSRPAIAWVFIPACVMSLGWGLRGYIGGGPYGAMIPGALVMLMICQYLGYSARAAAAVVAFGAFGVGFGGLMTYGQTLGLLRPDETFSWGLTGTTLKGGVWGLLGGAVIGLGFAARHIPLRHIVFAFLLMLAGVIVGIHEINAPKLIYFSDPVNKPRDESWAGLLLGALALLGYVRLAAPRFVWIPARFAAYGLIGGAIGFGPGSLFIAIQARVSETWNWMPFWKYMEFSFGFAFGAALGLCALHLRERLAPLGTADDSPASRPTVPAAPFNVIGILELLAGSALVFAGLKTSRYLMFDLFQEISELPATDIRRTLMQTLFGFTGMGCLMMTLSARWRTAAWQTAISLTIAAAAFDWQDKLLDRGEINMPDWARDLYWIGTTCVSILFVHLWQRRAAPKLMTVFLFATIVLMGIGYMKALGMSDIWCGNPEAEAAAGGRGAYLWQQYRGEIVVHAIFTTLFIISIAAGLKERRRHVTA